jgi:hypothetical protein
MDGADGYRIIVLDTNFNLIRNFGTSSDFVGPRRFICTINGPITFIDENNGGSIDKIIQLEDIYGTNWNEYGQTGSLEGQFQFYY